jgi:hypothetical protein
MAVETGLGAGAGFGAATGRSPAMSEIGQCYHGGQANRIHTVALIGHLRNPEEIKINTGGINL